MKFFKILLCVTFIFLFSACGDKKNFYDDYYDDGDNTSSGGDIGNRCRKDKDCKSGLVCINKVCSNPVTDDDSIEDTDIKPDENEPADDTDSGQTHDSDTDTPDNTDSGTNDGDEPTDDTDSQPDEDQYVPKCGDGIKDADEECDNGLNNSDEPGIVGLTCRMNCTLATCGDGIADTGELCDDGNRADGDYCRNDCEGITGYCGDGIEQANEVCDTRNNPYCKECSEKLGECGDGILQKDIEFCDNADPSIGNHEGIGSYCSPNCQEQHGRCGDGILQSEMEQCDDGAENGNYGKCNYNCTGYAPSCGDGILHRANCNGYGSSCVVFDGANEECDDGNNKDGDYCSADCQTKFGECGDGIFQKDLEACDNAKPGVGNGQGVGAYCTDNCQTLLGRCGDGKIQEGIEECDYGEYGESGPVPNGTLNCDYNDHSTCKRCTLDCKKIDGKVRFCGDGTLQQGIEECDNADPSVGNHEGIGPFYCSNECKVIGYCGDGKIQQNEECDPQNTDDPNTPYCSDKCKIEGRCGDKILNGNEECDNGETGINPNGNKRCPYEEQTCEVCTLECKKTVGTIFSYCGDGRIDRADCNGIDNCSTTAGANETCDSGINNGKYSFYSPGNCNSDCKDKGEGGYCGDGKVQRANCNGFNNCITAEGANETCDNGTDNGKTECAYGEKSCKVCSKSCVESNGQTSYCGDGKIDRANNEVCDDGNNNDGDYCSANCKTTGSCGDGTKQSNEECDEGSANNGHYQHDAPGHCNEDCKGRGEGGYCGDGKWQENYEECDNGGSLQIYCPYGNKECQVCTSSCTLETGKTAFCNDGIIQREDCTGYDNCVVVEGAHETCDDGEKNGKYGGFCNSTCNGITPHCNDGILQRENCKGYNNCVVVKGADEECDDGEHNGQYFHDAPGYCDYGCKGRGNGGFCGDGIKQDGNEKCDDGNENGKYGKCNNDCSGDSPKCGDGILHRENCTGFDNCFVVAGANEECDDGRYNSTYNRCNNNCSAKLTCGDGILQRADCTGYDNCVVVKGANEECDDGAENGNYEKCNTTCSGYNEGGFCGDGILQKENCEGYDICDENTTTNCCVEVAGANEKCDSGANNGKYSAEAPGYCNTHCDGFAEGGTCNDGIIQRADCTGFDICDENTTENCCVVTEGANENCDEGSYNGQYDHCNSTCSGTSHCGDGILQPEETCDDGFANGSYGSHCNKNCNGYTGYCDDGIIQRENCNGYDNCVEVTGANEECDDNIFYNGTYGHCNDECSAYRTERCGDGRIQRENCSGFGNCDVVPGAYENCDEGDTLNGKFGHCDKKCEVVINYKCGDGKVQKKYIEDCGDMIICNQSITTNCCEVVVFAQGDVPEFCDEGSSLNGKRDHCNFTCSGMTPYCGDGKVQKNNIEDCGDMIICSQSITTNCCEVVKGMNEKCDDGPYNNHYGRCNAECSAYRTERCGDGRIQRENCSGFGNCDVVPGANERCDEGPDNGTYYGHCDNNCLSENLNGYCGDNKIQKEDCGDMIICDENITKNCCEIVNFKPGDTPETCDDGPFNSSKELHGHCNQKCNGTYSCGDGIIGKDEICEPNGTIEIPGMSGVSLYCFMIPQFTGNDPITSCDDKCMPILSNCHNNPSYIIPFFDTKQTICYRNSDAFTECPDESDAFYGQSGNFAYMQQDYTEYNETISESKSRLTWQKKVPSSYSGCTTDPTSSSCTFVEAFTYCDNLNLDGKTDWRLPSAFELPAIADFAADNHIYSGFETKTGAAYWTAEGGVFATSDGTLTQEHFNSNNPFARVKCVRSDGEPCPTCANNKPFVLDYPHALITVFGEAETFTFWYFKNLKESVSWKDALIACKDAAPYTGINNMRLPTINELIHLIDPITGKSLIPEFTGKAWTSTTFSGNAEEAYIVDFKTGNITIDSKMNSHIVICVE